jgi:pyruvate dehydrogenase (quinone)
MLNAADILIDTLIAWDVEVIFGLPGDGINGIMEALRTRQDRIRFVEVRHEESAAFMATAYAKWTGKLGVCLATSGPGGAHLLTGLYDAKLDQAPVLAITGMQYHDLIETFTQQDVNLVRVFEDVSVFNAQVSGPEHLENLASLACRSALAGRGVAHLSIASDTQEKSLDESERSKRNKPSHVPNQWFAGADEPSRSEIEKAAEILNGATKVAILAGRGALNASDELERTADLLGAPIIKALLGKAVIADTNPLTTGGIGLLGTLPSQKAMEQCEALLIVGSTFPYIEYYPKPGQARGIQIDTNAQRIGPRYPVEAGLVGDPRTSLTQLNELLTRKADRSFLEQAQEGMAQWRSMMRQAEDRTGLPLKPERATRAFGIRVPNNAVLTTDSGQNTEMAARHIDLGMGNAFGVSGALASMATGVSYAIAAGIAFPGRPICAVVGDGGFAMQLGEFSTAVRYGIDLKVLVLKNNMLNQIAWEQMMFLGNPQFGCELQPIDFAKAAEAMGGRGFSITSPEEVDRVMDEAFATPGAVVIEALVDQYEPMMPPKMPPGFAENFNKALPQTLGRERIEDNIAAEPLRTMMKAGQE